MSLEAIGVIALVAVLVLFLFGRKRKPSERTFKCSRCSTVSEHTQRTIEAWRAGKAKFFCKPCHERWLLSHAQPAHRTRNARAPGSSGDSGCLGVMILLILLLSCVFMSLIFASA